MADLPTSSLRKRRRWLSFSLRTLLVFITLLCIFLGIWMERALRQHEIVNAIRDAGGWVEYEMEEANWMRNEAEPLWQKNPFGRDLLHCAQSVTLHDGRLLPQVARLYRLKSLTIYDNRLMDADVAAIQRLTGLKSLQLVGSWDREMARVTLSFMPTLGPQHCPLYGYSQLTDRSLEYVGRLPALEELTLSGDMFSEAGIERLAKIVTLRECYLDWCSRDSFSPQKRWLNAFRRLARIDVLVLLGPEQSIWLVGVKPWNTKVGDGIYEVESD
ncbi:MAG: hypothetical protein WEH44_03885 [Pirellulaceae bacterium]